jgi:glycyl-tRNA synthetase beta chain
MSSQSLLVELFVEELPPKALKKLGESFASVLLDALKAQGLTNDVSAVTHFATPRRLAAHVTAVNAKAADKQVAQKLMPATVGLDANGNATPALVKKLQTLGADETAVAQLRKENDGKADVLFLDATQAGATLAEGLQKVLDEALAKLPIPKVMTYQLHENTPNAGWDSVNFVRPAHGLVALHGSQVVPVSTLGLTAGNTTQGHRFEAKNAVITIQSADSYAQQLKEEGAVIASFDERRAEIVNQLNAAAAKENLKPIEDDALLDEVTALVELPNVLLGQFENEFLEVPQECLILTMKANQKYFPLLDTSGKLTNKFLIVSNIKPADPSKVVGGNERVVRPRLADAKFFFDQDRKKTLESRIAGLDKVVYHNKLGSQGERTKRVKKIAKWIAEHIGANPELAERAAYLAKADLLTDMVGEFPELQGVMGSYYALHDGENEKVAAAIADQYLVRLDESLDGDSLISVSLLIADKIETIVGIWSIGLKPTGDKDPFALRRHAIGIVQAFQMIYSAAALSKQKSKLDLNELLTFAAQTFEMVSIGADVLNEISDFIYERSKNQLLSIYSSQTMDAVVSILPPLGEIAKRASAVKAFEGLNEAPALAAANKRVGNILKKVEGELSSEVKASLLQEPAEQALAESLNSVKPKADQLFEAGDYTASLQTLAALKAAVDAFFDHVMVNAEDIALRNNRLALLNQLHQAMNRVADLSKLAS